MNHSPITDQKQNGVSNHLALGSANEPDAPQDCGDATRSPPPSQQPHRSKRRRRAAQTFSAHQGAESLRVLLAFGMNDARLGALAEEMGVKECVAFYDKKTRRYTEAGVAMMGLYVVLTRFVPKLTKTLRIGG